MLVSSQRTRICWAWALAAASAGLAAVALARSSAMYLYPPSLGDPPVRRTVSRILADFDAAPHRLFRRSNPGGERLQDDDLGAGVGWAERLQEAGHVADAGIDDDQLHGRARRGRVGQEIGREMEQSSETQAFSARAPARARGEAFPNYSAETTKRTVKKPSIRPSKQLPQIRAPPGGQRPRRRAIVQRLLVTARLSLVLLGALEFRPALGLSALF